MFQNLYFLQRWEFLSVTQRVQWQLEWCLNTKSIYISYLAYELVSFWLGYKKKLDITYIYKDLHFYSLALFITTIYISFPAWYQVFLFVNILFFSFSTLYMVSISKCTPDWYIIQLMLLSNSSNKTAILHFLCQFCTFFCTHRNITFTLTYRFVCTFLTEDKKARVMISFVLSLLQ